MNNRVQGGNRVYVAFALSIIVAFTLKLVQVPHWLLSFWPDWIALVMVVWALQFPQKVTPLIAFIVGTMLEVLTAKTFGVVSIGLATLVFLVNLSHLQLRVLSSWQQVFLVVVLVAFSNLINLWLDGLVGGNKISAEDWYSIVGNIVVWPFINIILSEVRRAFRIR